MQLLCPFWNLQALQEHTGTELDVPADTDSRTCPAACATRWSPSGVYTQRRSTRRTRMQCARTGGLPTTPSRPSSACSTGTAWRAPPAHTLQRTRRGLAPCSSRRPAMQLPESPGHLPALNLTHRDLAGSCQLDGALQTLELLLVSVGGILKPASSVPLLF